MTTNEKLNALATTGQQKPAEVVALGFGSSEGFAMLQRAANLLAASTLVPKEFQQNLPNCVVALNMATRLEADPLMVMQNLYVVHGRPSWSAQFVIACFNQCGRFSSMRYRWFNKPENPKPGAAPDNWGCQAYATELATGEEIEGPIITIAMAKAEGWYGKQGSKWKTIPDLMLMYRAGAWLQRTHAPDISMGLRTEDEERDIIDVTPTADGTFEAPPTPADELKNKLDDLAAGKTITQEAEPTKEQSEPSEPLPDSAAQVAIDALRSKRALHTLNEEFERVKAEYSGADSAVPPEVTAVYLERREHFEKSQSKNLPDDHTVDTETGEVLQPGDTTTDIITKGTITAALMRAKTEDECNDALDLARELPDEERTELLEVYSKRIEKLRMPAGFGGESGQATL